MSSRGDNGSIYLLNPQAVTPEGEWEAWYLNHAEITRYRSFWDMLHAQRQRFFYDADGWRMRQSALPELKVAKLADVALIAEARQHADWLWSQDPYLRALEHAALRERVFLFWKDFMAH